MSWIGTGELCEVIKKHTKREDMTDIKPGDIVYNNDGLDFKFARVLRIEDSLIVTADNGHWVDLIDIKHVKKASDELLKELGIQR